VIIPEKDEQGNIVQTNKPFGSKGAHTFKGTGVKKDCPANATTNIDLVIPDGMNYDLSGIEILNGALDDMVQLKVLDHEGVYTTVVDFELDQFGINWNAKAEMIKQLPYVARVMQKMKLRVEYVNNGTEARKIYVNYDLHKVATV